MDNHPAPEQKANSAAPKLVLVGGAILVLIIAAGVIDLVRKAKAGARRAQGVVVAASPSQAVGPDHFKAGRELFVTCAACHGTQGEGNKELHAPALRVQEDWYIARQLTKFKGGLRGTHPEDINGIAMQRMAMVLTTDKAVKEVAAYIASLKSTHRGPLPTTIDGDVERGKALYMACLACHGETARGKHELNAPALVGQHDWYLVQQLRNFKAGLRGADPQDATGAVMRPMAMTLVNDQAVNDVVAYICSLELLDEAPAIAESPHPPDAELGAKLFARNCVACHQEDGRGQVGLAPSIGNRDFLAIASDDFIRKTIHTGRPGTAMVPRPDLSTFQVNDIIAFLRSLPVTNPVAITVDPQRKFSGDIAAGRDKFHLYCAACHGTYGQGYSEGGSGPGIGLHGFLSTASDDYIYQTVKHGRVGTAMRPFIGPAGLAQLAERDVQDIVVYLRSRMHQEELDVAKAAAELGPGDPDHGQRLYATNCAACHQPDGQGKTGLAPSIRNRDFLALASDDFIRRTVTQGRPGTAMVGRPDLAGQPLKHIIAFLRALPVTNPVAITVDDQRVHRGDATAGHGKFATYCASCHGDHGQGYSAGGSGPGIGLPGFLQVASDDYIFQTVKQGRVGTAMMPFIGAVGLANLTESDVRDIIASLRVMNH